MQVLVVGDVHACYYTLKKLLKAHWNPGNTVLVQLGDLINKGPYTSKCIDFWLQLQEQHEGRVFWLLGNHEYALLNKFKSKPSSESIHKLETALQKRGRSLSEVMLHIAKLPLKWENDHLFISHAGLAKKENSPYQLDGPYSILNNREELKTLDKIQVVGHNVVVGNKPVFSPKENAWHIDTGAWTKKYLSALLFNEKGEATVIRQPVDAKDQPDY